MKNLPHIIRDAFLTGVGIAACGAGCLIGKEGYEFAQKLYSQDLSPYTQATITCGASALGFASLGLFLTGAGIYSLIKDSKK